MELSKTNKPLIIFDLDGTLFQSAPVFGKAVRMAAKEIGITPPDSDIINSMIGFPLSSCTDMFRSFIDKAKISKLMQLIDGYETQLISKIGKPFDGILSILDNLTQRGLLKNLSFKS